MKEQFTIRDIVDNFANWANNYGRKRQGQYYVPHPHGYDHMLHAAGTPDKPFGYIRFSIEHDANDDELVHIAAEPWNGDHPPSDELIAYLREMAAAIRERWSETTGGEQKPKTRNRADDWLIEQYFDIHQGNRKPITFADEWLRIRQEQDGNIYIPLNVADSVRQVIAKERTRRQGNDHE